MDAHDAIARRTSTRTFKKDALPRYAIERLLAAAVRAPNHKLTEPWRFAVLTGEGKQRYAELRRAHRARKFDNPEDPESARKIEKTYREALDTPAIIVVMCAVSDDPVRREEDFGAVMMAIENLLVAAAADGIGSYIRTGGLLEHPDLKTLVGLAEGFRIVAVVSLGYLAATPEPTLRRKPLSEIVRWLE